MAPSFGATMRCIALHAPHWQPSSHCFLSNTVTQVLLQGNAEAWFHLGTMYLNGWGVKPSQRQAVEYFALAAQMNHVLGMYNLAMMHLHGRAGLPGAEGKTNCPPALALLKKITEKGSWGALVQQVTR